MSPKPASPTEWPDSFGFDVVDVVEWELDDLTPPFGYDTVDWIEDGLHHALPVLCPSCGEEWLSGPKALAAGKCWRCRTGGGR
jgi:hypothetical protein